MDSIERGQINLLPLDRNHGRHRIYTNEKNHADISIHNFGNICRFCLIGSSEVKLCANKDDNSFYKLCSSLLSVMINSEDELPLNICKVCELKILGFHEFKQSVLEVQHILANILGKQQGVAKQENVFDACSMYSNNEEGAKTVEEPLLKEIYKCKICKEEFTKVAHYRRHLKLEQEKRKDRYSTCTVCKKLFLKRKLAFHMEIHSEIHGEIHNKIKESQSFQCDVCGKNYRTKRNLNRHSLTHTGMPNVCDICGKGFREANLLKDHLNVHAGLTPHLCNICGSSYPTSSALRLHKAYKHKGKKRKLYSYPKKTVENCIRKPKKVSFPCEICGKLYASKAIVNYHVLTHSDEKTFQCNDCGKMFANKSILGDHRRIHRLSYKCRYCERSFAYAASLKTHLNSHTGEKPHECNVCGKRYSNKSHMKEHLRTHTGERPYSCSICGKTFAAKGNLNGHMKTHQKESDTIC